jgi:hypothetical protein
MGKNRKNQKMDKVIFEKRYTDESLLDMEEDILYKINRSDITKDEHGFYEGVFKVTVTWSQEGDNNG